MIEFEYILGGDLTLNVQVKVTNGFAGDQTDPPHDPEMEIQKVTFSKAPEAYKLPRIVDFEIDDIYIKHQREYHSLEDMIIEEGWDHIGKMEREE